MFAIVTFASVALPPALVPALVAKVEMATPPIDLAHRIPFLDLSLDGRWAVTADPGWHGTFNAAPRRLAVWDTRTSATAGVFEENDPWWVPDAFFVGDGSTLLISGRPPSKTEQFPPTQVVLVSIPALKPVRKLDGHRYDLFTVSPDRSLILSARRIPVPPAENAMGRKDREIWDVWDWKVDKRVATLDPGPEYLLGRDRTRIGASETLANRGVTFTADGKRFTAPAEYWSKDANLTHVLPVTLLWDLNGAKVEKYLWDRSAQEDGADAVAAAAITPDGSGVAAFGGGWPTSVMRFWDVGQRKAVRTGLNGPLAKQYPTTMRYMPDGKTLLVAGPAGVVAWDTKADRIVSRFGPWVYNGNRDVEVSRLVMTPDGSTAATLTKEGTLEVWRLPRRWSVKP